MSITGLGRTVEGALGGVVFEMECAGRPRRLLELHPKTAQFARGWPARSRAVNSTYPALRPSSMAGHMHRVATISTPREDPN